MKTFLPLDTMSLHCDTVSKHDFPRLARESGFSFNLFRGRVDWAKIGAIDVDKMVRERDLETLQSTLPNIMSCCLDNEYDLKVLDPNFVKLFRLAQLAADFLLYCRNYLDHCVTVMQEQLRVALQEVEQSQKHLQQRTEEVNSLQRKLKSKSRSCNSAQCTVPVPYSKFKCTICMKLFVGEQYLLEHQRRRHSELSAADSFSANQSKEIDSLHQLVKQLQDRLHATEESLKNSQSTLPDVVALQTLMQQELQKLKPIAENQSALKLNSNTVQCLDISGKTEGLKQPNMNSQIDESGRERQSSIAEITEHLNAKHEADQAALRRCIEEQNHEIKALRDQLQEQHQAHKAMMQKTLDELQQQHRADLDDLRLSVTRSRAVAGLQTDVAANEVAAVGNSSRIPSAKAWEKLCEIERAGVKAPGVGLHLKKGDMVISSQSSKSIPGIPVFLETNQSKAGEELAVQEKYESPSDHESSESSSAAYSSNANSFHETDVDKEVEKSNDSIHSPAGTENIDAPDHSKSMYEKSSNSSNSTESESGTSSYDSDSQSSNSEQQPSKTVNSGDKLRLQLTPEILTGLKEDLLGLLNRRLRELGVDPEWNRLPVDSYHSNMATVKHHQNIAAKSQKSYFDIQEAIIKEVDKRVVDRLKQQQPISKSPGLKKKYATGSFSIFARLKSKVKKLSHSGRSSPPSLAKQSQNTAMKLDSWSSAENEYSQEPSASKSAHEYETLQETTSPSTAIAYTVDSSIVKQSQESNVESSNTSDYSVLATKLENTNIVYENIGEKTKPVSSGVGRGVKVYGRSMYANLNRSEVEVAKKDLLSHSTPTDPASLQTSTPIKAGAELSGGEKTDKPQFLSSDVESISELESDLNDISNKPSSVTQTRPHTTRTTAELLASVAKLRQNSSDMNATQTVVKSNLKSSLSTGNIMKKRVVFRDEKDGFNTIELGPAHSSHESIVTQRSQSESSLAMAPSNTQSSDRPVPQPRNIHMASTAPVLSANTDNTDSDWDWDKDDSENTTLKSIEPKMPSNSGSSRHTLSNIKDSSWNSTTTEDKQWNASSADVSRVSDIVRDIEKKLQTQKGKPSFGINITGSHQSTVHISGSLPGVSHISSENGVASSVTSSPKLSQSNESPHDNLSELLLDDFSSS